MTVLNISSKTTGPVVTKFYTDPHFAVGRKVCSNSLGHINNMAAMPPLFKNSSTLEPVDRLP